MENNRSKSWHCKAKARGLEIVAVTGHNTTSPLQEKEQVEQEQGLEFSMVLSGRRFLAMS